MPDSFIPDEELDSFTPDEPVQSQATAVAEDSFVEDKPNPVSSFFENILEGFKKTKQKQDELAAQQQQQEVAQQQAIAEQDADPSTWSSNRFAKEAPKPQTLEEKALYDSILASKKAHERALAENIPEIKSAEGAGLRSATTEEQEEMQRRREVALAREFPTDYQGGSIPFDAFMGSERTPGARETYPVEAFVGDMTRLVVASAATGGVAPIVARSQIFDKLPNVARFIGARAAHTGATFGLKKTADELLNYVFTDQKDISQSAKEIAGEIAFGSGMGAIGGIPKFAVRLPSEIAYGFAYAKLRGADTLSAGVNGALFGLFGLLNRENYSEAMIKEALTGFKKAVIDRAVDLGHPKEKAVQFAEVAEKKVEQEIRARGGEVSIKDLQDMAKGISEGGKIVFNETGVATTKEPSMKATTTGEKQPEIRIEGPKAQESFVPDIPSEPQKQPYIRTLYQGRGKALEEIYKYSKVPAAGEGQYYAFSETTAKNYGEKVEKKGVTLKNPLFIENDSQWRQLTKEAQWVSSNPTYDIESGKLTEKGMKDQSEFLKRLVLSKGHDGIVFAFEDTHEISDEAESLARLFGHDQVVDYNEQPVKQVTKPVETPKPRAKEIRPFDSGEQIALKAVFEDIRTLEAPRRMVVEETGKTIVTGYVPPYLKEQGVVKKADLPILQKAFKGEPLTEKQYDRAVRLAYLWIEEQERFYGKKYEELFGELAQSEAEEAIRLADQAEPPLPPEAGILREGQQPTGELAEPSPTGGVVKGKATEKNYQAVIEQLKAQPASELNIRSAVKFGESLGLLPVTIYNDLTGADVSHEFAMQELGKTFKNFRPKKALTPSEEKLVKGERVIGGLQAPMKKELFQEEGPLFKKEKAPSKKAASGTHGLAASSWQVSLEREVKVKGRVNKTQMVRWVEEAFGVPIRSKLTHMMTKLSGFYKQKEQIIRLKKWGELEVLTHEAAHHIDFGIITPIAGKGWRTKDIPAGFKKRVTSELAGLDYDPKRRATSEGFAEFIRHWVTNTGYAPKLAPEFNKFFEGDFKKLYPEVAQKLEKMRELYTIWDKQGAVARVLGHVDFKGEHTKLPISKKIGGMLDWIRKQFEDEFYILKDIEKELGIVSRKDVPPTKSAFEMATYMKQKSSGIARTFVLEATVDELGNKTGKGLVEILRPLVNMKDIGELMKPGFMRTHEGTKIGDFVAYWISQRAIKLGSRGIESGFDIGDARFIVDKFKSAEFDKVAEELTAWADSLVDWNVRAGGLKPGTEDLFRALNPIYVPFKRAFLEQDRAGGGKLFSRSSGFMSIRGSARPIINPFESLIRSAGEMISKAHKIRLSNLITDLAKIEGAGKWVNEIPLATSVTKISMSKVLDKLFKDLQDEGLVDDFPDLDDIKDQMLIFFGKTAKYTKKDNVVAVFRKGELKLYELHPDLYATLQGLDPIQLNSLTKILSPFTRFLRLGATGINAAFGLIRNPIRDFVTATIFSKSKTYTPLSSMKGVISELTAKPGDPAYRFKAAGGDISSQMGYDRAQTMAIYDEALVLALGKTGKALFIAKHPIDTIRSLVNIPEMGPRVAELERSMKRYKKEHPDWSDDDIFVAAFNDAQDITINFSKSGKLGKQINQAVFAFNAATQGINKFYRAMRDNPFDTISRGLLWISIASIAAWYYNRDKDWYQNLPPAYRYNNLFFELPDGNVVRAPIPFDIGVVFSAVPVSMLDVYYEKNPELYQGLVDLAVAQVPNPVDISAVSPAWDVATNRDYLGRPIESKTLQRLPSEERKHDYTPQYASALSKGFNGFGMKLSPVQISYLMNSYSGGLTTRLPGQKAKEAADIPVAGALFLRNPERPNYQLNKFYERYQELQEKKAANMLNAPKDRRDYARYTIFQRDILKPLTDRAKFLKSRGKDEMADRINKKLSTKLKLLLNKEKDSQR